MILDYVLAAWGGVLLLGLGISLGRASERRRHNSRPAPDPYARFVCGCTHHLAIHDPQTGVCNGSVRVDEWSKKQEDYIEVDRPCGCRQYIGERPVDQDALAELFTPRPVDPPTSPE